MIRQITVLALLVMTGCGDSRAPQTDGSTDPSAKVTEARSGYKTVPSEASVTRDTGQAFLYINAQKPGVKVMKSGLQFEMLKSGEGRSPSIRSTVVTHYRGAFVNGEVFDSSVERGEPATFPVNKVIAGWTQALQMMKEGDVWRLVIPPELAYGEKGFGSQIPPNSVLVFEVELIEVRDG